MSVSLAKLDQRLSSKRRDLSSKAKEREELYAAVDDAMDSIDALEAKDDLSDEDKETLSAKKAEAKSKAKEATELSDSIRDLQSEVSDLESQKAERQEHIRQTGSVQPRELGSADSDDPAPDVTVAEPTAEQLDHDISCYMRNSFIARMSGNTLVAVCQGVAGDQYRNDRLAAAVTQSANPAILPTNHSNRLIELLRPRTVCRNMEGVNQLPLPNGNMRMPRQSAASTAAYAAEMANIATSDVSTEPLSLAAKKLTAMVIQSGELMRHSSPASDKIIRNDIIKVLSLKEDATFIRAAGSATVPKGLKAFADADSATQVVTANQTVNLANVTNDIGKLILALANANCPMLNPHFLMAPRTERFLMDLRDGNGNYAFPEMARGQLRGFPYKTTTQIPINLTVNSTDDCSELYLVDASEFIIADTDTFELNVSLEAAYHDGTNVQAAFSQDAAAFRLIVEHDTLMRHNESVAYLEQLTWGV
jgi:HK97 family phage major capsid protein